jgi:mevalonate kinase
MTQLYVGTKIVKAWPQDRPSETDPEVAVKGYAVEYSDGYTSWCPKEQFEAANVVLPAAAWGAPEWMQRVYAERVELRNKFDKLTTFLSSMDVAVVGFKQAELLFAQRDAMAEYGGILDACISIYEAKTTT